jgi:hypothetical protein
LGSETSGPLVITLIKTLVRTSRSHLCVNMVLVWCCVMQIFLVLLHPGVTIKVIVGTNTIRAYDTISAPGSKAVATPSADAVTVTADASADAYRSQSWEVRETMSLGYPKLMVI